MGMGKLLASMDIRLMTWAQGNAKRLAERELPAPAGRRGHRRQQGVAAAACQDQGRRARAGLCGRGASGGLAAAPCQHRCDSCNEWAKEPPQRHTVPDCQHMALLRTAEKQQQQRRQQTDLPAGLGGERRNDSPLRNAGQQAASRTKLSTAAATAGQKSSVRANRLDGDFWAHGSSLSAWSARGASLTSRRSVSETRGQRFCCVPVYPTPAQGFLVCTALFHSHPWDSGCGHGQLKSREAGHIPSSSSPRQSPSQLGPWLFPQRRCLQEEPTSLINSCFLSLLSSYG